MEVTVRLFAMLRERAGAPELKLELPEGARVSDALASEPPFGASMRKPYPSYYDDDLRELVRRKARRIVDAFGYDFEN